MSIRDGAEQTLDTPVLIAGGGAVGCLLALMLAHHGVASIVVERALTPQTAPRAHALNPRSLEILRQFEFDSAVLSDAALSVDFGGYVRFVSTVLGHQYGVIPYERQDDAVEALTPTRLMNIPQPDFEQILFRSVADQPLIDYRRGVEWTSCREREGSIESEVREGGHTSVISSAYLVGADGAGSAVREHLNIAMVGERDVSSAVSITFKADLTRLLADRPAVLYWVTEPSVRGTLLAYRAESLWNYILTRPPGRIDMQQFDAARCELLIRGALGVAGTEPAIEILDAIPWTMRSEVAETYRAGRAFLVGDAAHRFPPTGGLGLNSGIQDAHNLQWKLAHILRKDAADALLDTYTEERRPIAGQNAQQSLDNTRRLVLLDELAWPSVLDPGPDFTTWLERPGRAERVSEIVDEQRPHFDSLALQLGFSYAPGAEQPEDISVFEPRLEIGARFPHAWLERDGARISTLDLLDPGRFTLLRLGGEAALPGGTDTLRYVRLAPEDFEVLDWAQRVGFPPTAVAVVRPDGHVLAILDGASPLDLAGAAVDDYLRGVVTTSRR